MVSGQGTNPLDGGSREECFGLFLKAVALVPHCGILPPLLCTAMKDYYNTTLMPFGKNALRKWQIPSFGFDNDLIWISEHYSG